MATRKQHIRDCENALGSGFEEVHAWLDGLACVNGKLNINHRRYRHHREVFDEIRELFGEDGVKAAIIHLNRDFGYIPSRAQVEEMFPDEPELINFPNRVNKRKLRKYG